MVIRSVKVGDNQNRTGTVRYKRSASNIVVGVWFVQDTGLLEVIIGSTKIPLVVNEDAAPVRYVLTGTSDTVLTIIHISSHIIICMLREQCDVLLTGTEPHEGTSH